MGMTWPHHGPRHGVRHSAPSKQLTAGHCAGLCSSSSSSSIHATLAGCEGCMVLVCWRWVAHQAGGGASRVQLL